jgi:hypothetical protein
MLEKQSVFTLMIVGVLVIPGIEKSSYAATAQTKKFQCNGYLNLRNAEKNTTEKYNFGAFYLGISGDEVEISGATLNISGRYSIEQREPHGIQFGNAKRPRLYGFFNRFSGDLQVSETSEASGDEIKMNFWLSETTCVDAKPLF